MKDYDHFITNRLDSILDRPGMWGGNEAVELQVLQLLEFLAFHKLDNCPTRFVLDRYIKFIQGQNLLSTLPLCSQFERIEDIVDKLKMFRKQIEDELSPPKNDYQEMTAKEFESKFGVRPFADDLERVNCKLSGEVGHYLCGICDVCQKPRIMCCNRHGKSI